AAMKGSRELKFEPAKTLGQAVPVSILLPVFFRHPDAPPLAGDSIIPRDTAAINAAARDSAKADSAKAAAAKAPAKKPAVTPKRKTTRR
ncbi:MAG: hypothetical protein ABJB95_04860, partial [Gemmatimonadales bacterium]